MNSKRGEGTGLNGYMLVVRDGGKTKVVHPGPGRKTGSFWLVR